jgi:hypothetical protein
MWYHGKIVSEWSRFARLQNRKYMPCRSTAMA